MNKIIACINVTLDGYCDHTAIVPNDELHIHYSELLKNFDTILYGRITYQLMEYWKSVLENPTGNKSYDEFALYMDSIEKIVFSRTIKNLDWKTAKLSNKNLKDEVMELKENSGKDILVGSRSLINQLLKLNLIDEFQLCIHPVIAGKGLKLFDDDFKNSINLELINTKTLSSGAIVMYYEPLVKT
ncbi:MAG TPA: dihydrofolate reductase family protein [Ignavibacteria bacterium]|nr:dihydrofolate reductase family protein [Ignavibacteria bacterium]